MAILRGSPTTTGNGPIRRLLTFREQRAAGSGSLGTRPAKPDLRHPFVCQLCRLSGSGVHIVRSAIGVSTRDRAPNTKRISGRYWKLHEGTPVSQRTPITILGCSVTTIRNAHSSALRACLHYKVNVARPPSYNPGNTGQAEQAAVLKSPRPLCEPIGVAGLGLLVTVQRRVQLGGVL